MSAPYCKSLLLCEVVTCDAFTDKWSLINVKSHVTALSFPARIPRLACYASVYDAGGTVRAKFKLLDPDLNELVVLDVPPLETQRREENEFGAVFTEVVLAKPGRYSVEFHLDGQFLQSARLDARQFEPSGEPA